MSTTRIPTPPNNDQSTARHLAPGESGCCPSDVQSNEDSESSKCSERVSFLDNSEGDIKIAGGQFNAVGGNQFRLEVNVNGWEPKGSQRHIITPMASNKARIDNENTDDYDDVEKGRSPPPEYISENSESGASRVTQQLEVHETPYTIYFRCLATRERGSPLWIPEPNRQLSIEYQRNGLVIGDVGIITEQGCFDSLFNISLPPDHPLAINSDELPQNFSPLEIKPSHILKFSQFKKGASLSSGSVSVTTDDSSGLTFESSASKGAILTLPDGSISQDLRNKKKLLDHLAVHSEEIYRCAMIEHGRIIKNGDLRVVTGFDKTSSWGMAAFSNSTSQTKPSFRLEFQPRDQSCPGRTHSWKSSGTAEVKAGPDTEEVVALRLGDSSQQDVVYANQTVFVRTETLTLHPRIWNALVSESGTGELEPDGDSDTNPNSHSENTASPRSGNSPTRGNGGHSATNGSCSKSFSSTNTLRIHPSNAINAMLLKLNPSARMAITGDDIWISVLKNEDTTLPSSEALWSRIIQSYDVCLQDGVVFLAKLPSKQLSVCTEFATEALELTSMDYEPILNEDPTPEWKTHVNKTIAPDVIQVDRVIEKHSHAQKGSGNDAYHSGATSFPVISQNYGKKTSAGDAYNESTTFYPPVPHSFSGSPSFPAAHSLPSYSLEPAQSSSSPTNNRSTSGHLDPSTNSTPRYGGQRSPSFPIPQTFTHNPDIRHPGPPAQGPPGHYSPPPVKGPPRVMPLTNPSTHYSRFFPNGSRNFQYISTQSHLSVAVNHYSPQPPWSASCSSQFPCPTNAQYSHAQESREQSLPPTAFPRSEMSSVLSGLDGRRSNLPRSSASNYSPRSSLSPCPSQLPYPSNTQYINAQKPQEQALQRSIVNVYQRPRTSCSSSEMASGGSGLGYRHCSTILDSNSNFSPSLRRRGRRRGLCIGINYEGQNIALRGAANDAMAVREFLINQGIYNASDIVLLSERSSDPDLWPTYANILFQMEQLTKDAEPNDSLFFHFSGHGGLTKDLNGDEGLFGGMDSVIYSVDKQEIVDDDMHELMVQPLPKGCRLTALYDACHSGTVLDLPYVYRANGSLTFLSHLNFHARALKESPATVVSWSSCRDKELSADTYSGNTPVGAMSNAFINSLSESPNQSYQELLASEITEQEKSSDTTAPTTGELA